MSGLRLLLGGDVMLGGGVASVIAREGEEYPFAGISTLTKDADLFFVNLECALSALEPGSSKSAAESFQAGPGAARVLASAGVKLVNLANSRVMDAGIASLTDTLANLRQLGIDSAGAGLDLDDASAVRVVDVDGVHVAVLAVCDRHEELSASLGRPGIHYLDLRDSDARRHLVARARIEAARCDHLVVSLHWLPEWVASVPRMYRELAENLLAAGARVVWGHGPRHILGSQWGAEGVALYSTGSLIDDYPVDPNYRNDRQLLYLIELGRDGVERLSVLPISLTAGRAERADPEARRWIEARLRDSCHAFGSIVTAGPDAEFEIRPSPAGGGFGAAELP